MFDEDIVKSTQEQAVAAWTAELNALRIIDEFEKIAEQKGNLEHALIMLKELKEDIARNIVEIDRGHTSGMHGFIAERLQVWLENARNILQGEPLSYELVDDNGVDDLVRDGNTPIQMKFVISDKRMGLTRVLEHLKKYPDFLKRGGKYILPKDFYDRILKYYNMSEEEMNRLPKGERNFCSYVKEFFSKQEISINDIEPATVEYSEVQVKTYEKTIDEREEELKKENEEIENQIHEDHKASFEEGLKVTLFSASMAGGVQFLLGIYKKIKDGKKIQEFKNDDWKDVGISAGKGAIKGGIRGGVVYYLTNKANMSAAIASSYVTALFSVLLLERKRREKKISEEEFINLSQIACIDVAIAALTAMAGGALIPISILGSLVGNIVGTFVIGIFKENNINIEKKYKLYIDNELACLDKQLSDLYISYMACLNDELKQFDSLLAFAFSEDINLAFDKSIEFAEEMNVEEKYILRDMAQIDAFFNN